MASRKPKNKASLTTVLALLVLSLVLANARMQVPMGIAAAHAEEGAATGMAAANGSQAGTETTGSQDGMPGAPASTSGEATSSAAASASSVEQGAGEASSSDEEGTLSAQDVPEGIVTSEVVMNNGESKSGNFTIDTNGVVMTSNGGTATIQDGVVMNNASNARKGGIASSRGSALIANNQSTLILDNVEINSGLNNLVLNIWHNGGTVQANNLTLTGSANNDNATPFILIGQYGQAGGATLNFEGDSSIFGARGSIVGGNNSSAINVQSGTLAIKGSDIRVKNGIKLNVHDGATLVVDKDSHLALDDGSQIVVKSGGTLVFDGATYEQATPSIVLEAGATLRLKNGATFTTNPGAEAFEIKDGTTVEVASGSTFNLNVNKGMTIASGGTLKVDGGTLNVNGSGTDKGIRNAGTVELLGATVKTNDPTSQGIINAAGGSLAITSSQLENVWIENDATMTVDGSEELPSDLKSCVIKTRANTTLDIAHAKLHDSTRNSQDTMIHTAGDDAKVTIRDSEIYNNVNTMPAGNPGASIIKIVNGDLVMNNVHVHDNRCETRGGALYLKGGTLSIDGDAGGSVFERNSAQFLGGAIYMEDAEASIGAATFQKNGYQNDAKMTHQGGAICATRCYIGLEGTTFRENKALGIGRVNGPLGGVGGAIYVYGEYAASQERDTYLGLEGVKFYDNVAYQRGGALTVGTNAHAVIGDNGGDPTEFKRNTVTAGTDYSGGALFIDNAYVDMQDAAIYNNSAPDAGGGISTCPTGTAQVWSLEGAAIFDNKATEAGEKRADEEISSYQDLYVLTKNHRDIVTGDPVAGRDGFPVDWEFELVERMFAGGLHRWAVKNLNTTVGDHTYHSLIAQSDPTDRNVAGAKVVFTDNSVQRSADATQLVTGGAIACNGLLKVGTDTEIKIVKIWDDGNDADGLRDTMEQFANNIVLLANGEELSDEVKSRIQTKVMDLREHPYVLSDNVIGYEGEVVDYAAKYPGMDAWIAVISGLPVTDASGKEIVYTIAEKDVPGYTAVVPSEEDGIRFSYETYFELVNVHKPTGERYPKVTLEATKTLVGRELAEGEFSFELKRADGSLVEAKTCDANGVVLFDPLHFTKVGSYDYLISEVAGSDATVSYNPSVYRVHVVVSEGADRTMSAEVSYERDGAAVDDVSFRNEVQPSGTYEPVSVGLELTKTLEGDVLEAGQFSFHLYGADGELLETKTNDANGIVLFDALSFDRPGTYAYQIREDEGNPQITYDGAYHVVTFHVHDLGGGKLSLTKTIELNGQTVDSLSFHNRAKGSNSYAPVSVRLEATKTLVGRTLAAGEFSFKLDGFEGQTLQTKTNDARGHVVFDEVSVSKPGTYDFTISEVQGTAPGISYDTRSYVAIVRVREASDGSLVADAPVYTREAQKVAAAAFENRYGGSSSGSSSKAVVLPKTGDASPPVGVLALAGTAAVVASMARRRREA